MSFTEKNNSGKLPTKDSHNPILVTIYVFCITAHPPMKRNKFFLKKWSSVYLHTVLKFAFYTFIKNKRGLPGAARDYFTISLWNSPVQIDLRTQQPLGWGEPPTNKIFIHKPTRGATFVCWPPPNSQSMHPHLVGWTLQAPGLGEPPTNKILHCKPTPRSNFCLLAPAQFLTLQGFSDGVTIGGSPGGQHFGSPPGSVPSQGEMRSPRQISGWWLVWVRRQAAGHTHTHIHTYTHTFIFI